MKSVPTLIDTAAFASPVVAARQSERTKDPGISDKVRAVGNVKRGDAKVGRFEV